MIFPAFQTYFWPLCGTSLVQPLQTYLSTVKDDKVCHRHALNEFRCQARKGLYLKLQARRNIREYHSYFEVYCFYCVMAKSLLSAKRIQRNSVCSMTIVLNALNDFKTVVRTTCKFFRNLRTREGLYFLVTP